MALLVALGGALCCGVAIADADRVRQEREAASGSIRSVTVHNKSRVPATVTAYFVVPGHPDFGTVTEEARVVASAAHVFAPNSFVNSAGRWQCVFDRIVVRHPTHEDSTVHAPFDTEKSSSESYTITVTEARSNGTGAIATSASGTRRFALEVRASH